MDQPEVAQAVAGLRELPYWLESHAEIDCLPGAYQRTNCATAKCRQGDNRNRQPQDTPIIEVPDRGNPETV
jgi:hypothetical protein